MGGWINQRVVGKNKYGAKRTELDGRSFASKLEANTYAMLKLMEKANLISDIRCQKSITLTPSVKFKIDFVIFDHKLNKDVGIEAKGFEGERWRIIRQLWKDFGPYPLRVYKGAANRVYLSEEIRPMINDKE